MSEPIQPGVWIRQPTEPASHYPIQPLRVTAPFVSVAELRAHLKLLGAFHALRQRVESASGLAELDKDVAWSLFVSRAVYRFDKWAWINGPGATLTIAPLDVVMVHHCYLLNPRTYDEDTHRFTQTEAGTFPNFNIVDINARIGDDMLPKDVTSDQMREFQLATSEPFDLPIITTESDTCTIPCPDCSSQNTVPWITTAGAGYGQRFFHAMCATCSLRFDREAMGVRKLCADVKTGNLLSGTAINAKTGQYAYTVEAQNLSFSMTKGLSALGNTPQSVGAAVRFQMSRVEEECRKSFLGPRASKGTGTPTPRRLTKTLNAYRHPERASIELVGAVIRQASFIQKMVSFGWTLPGRFESDNGPTATPLLRAINRYHAFLSLMSGTSSLLVPTLDIDLVWHTHQLKAEAYRTDTFYFVGSIPDHDDAVEESTLSNAFDHTAKLWKERFSFPYSICGCSPDPVWNESLHTPIVPAQGHSAFTVQGNLVNFSVAAPDDCDTTHPSEHNAVLLVGDKLSEVKKRRREDDVEHRAHAAWKHSQKRAGKGKPETWTEVQTRNRETKREGHSEAMARSAPFWGGHDLPYAYYGFCRCTYEGNVVLAKAGECIAGAGTGSCAAGGGAACANKGAAHCGMNSG